VIPSGRQDQRLLLLLFFATEILPDSVLIGLQHVLANCDVTPGRGDSEAAPHGR
jgi:hypothetical protein